MKSYTKYKISFKRYNFTIRCPITCGLSSEMPIFLPETKNKSNLWDHYPTPFLLLGPFLALTGRRKGVSPQTWCPLVLNSTLSTMSTVDLLLILLLTSSGIVRFHMQAVSHLLFCMPFIFACLCTVHPTKKEVFQRQTLSNFP